MKTFNTKDLDMLLDNNIGPTKKEIKSRAASLGCEMRYSGKLKRGFIHRVVRYEVQYATLLINSN